MRDLKDVIIGYGVNRKDVCFRSGALDSYDYSFKTEERAEEFMDRLKEKGVIGNYTDVFIVTLYDEIYASVESLVETIEDTNGEGSTYLDLVDLDTIVEEYKEYKVTKDDVLFIFHNS